MRYLDISVAGLLPYLRSNSVYYILFLALVIGYTWERKKRKYAAAPIACIENSTLQAARERFRTDAGSMLREGYQKYKGRPFYVPSPLGERLMIPGKYVEELKTAPVDEVDFVGTFYEMFEGKYTTMGSRSTLHPRVAKQQLNQHLEQTLAPVSEEIDDAFHIHLPRTKGMRPKHIQNETPTYHFITADWAKVAIGDIFVHIVARVSSRMFGGTELSRHKEWVSATINFAVDGFVGAQAIKKYPAFIRPIVARWMPELNKISQHHATAQRVIVPILKGREGRDFDKPADFLQWMLDSARGEEAEKEFIATIQLKLSFAAIHTSAAAPTQLLYDLCARPEYIEPLIEEIEEVKAIYGGLESKQALRKLVKMDSFMKESQRFSPLLLITFERLITRDYTLSDGFFIPAGTTIGVPTQAISMDPSIYPDPETFDGFRFSKLRSSSNPSSNNNNALSPNTARLAYAASNLESMSFGYGRHACPGRFFADCEIKMIMAYLLLNYEFRFAGSTEGIEGRPVSLMAETQCLPNHEAKVMVKGRM